MSRIPRGAIAAALICGLAAGVGLYTFAYARGASYMTDDPRACANCHVMEEQYSGWNRSSHRSVAVCNDCHTPPGFPDPITITPRNHRVTQSSCSKCHAAIVDAIDSSGAHAGGERLDCLGCHRDVGHLH